MQTKQTRSAAQSDLPPRWAGTKLAPSAGTAEQQHQGRTCFTVTFEEQGTTPAHTPAFVTAARCRRERNPSLRRQGGRHAEPGPASRALNFAPRPVNRAIHPRRELSARRVSRPGRTESDCVSDTLPGASPSRSRVSGATTRQRTDAAGEERGDSDFSRVPSPPPSFRQ